MLFNKILLIFTIYLIAVFGLFAQDYPESRELVNRSVAEEMETMLNTAVVTYALASRFVLEAADVLTASRTSDPEEAFDYAKQHGWLPGFVLPDNPARLDHISLLLMRSFDLKGGIMYTLFKNSHYAYRELVFQNVIYGRIDPAMFVSGERLIFYVGRLLAIKEAMSPAEIRRQAEQREREAAARRQALAAEIANIITEQEIADITVEATDEGVLITLSNIMFLADSAVLPDIERGKIQEIAGVLSSISNVKLYIAGHTTIAGSDDYLQQLSEARAQSVADYLVSLGACEAANVIIAGYGGSRPVADNSTQAGMAANRRVEITILEN